MPSAATATAMLLAPPEFHGVAAALLIAALALPAGIAFARAEAIGLLHDELRPSFEDEPPLDVAPSVASDPLEPSISHAAE